MSHKERQAIYQYQMSHYMYSSVAIEEALGRHFDPRLNGAASGREQVSFSLETVLSLRHHERVSACLHHLSALWSEAA